MKPGAGRNICAASHHENRKPAAALDLHCEVTAKLRSEEQRPQVVFQRGRKQNRVNESHVRGLCAVEEPGEDVDDLANVSTWESVSSFFLIDSSATFCGAIERAEPARAPSGPSMMVIAARSPSSVAYKPTSPHAGLHYSCLELAGDVQSLSGGDDLQSLSWDEILRVVVGCQLNQLITGENQFRR